MDAKTAPWAMVVATAISIGAGCSDTVTARPQLLVVVDTDAVLTGQVDATESSARLAVDTLRVDLVERDGSISDFLNVVAPDSADWPLSFGVLPEDAEGEPLLIRLRVFGGAYASRGENKGVTTSEPDAALTIDRLIAASFPEQGVRIVGVAMAADCIGQGARFSEPLSTCVSSDDEAVGPDDAFTDLDEPWTDTRAGTWELAKSRDCEVDGPDDALCIPGGTAVLGERELSAPVQDTIAVSTPIVPVVMSPFWMDRTEFTIGRLRALLASGTYVGAEPDLHDPEHVVNQHCSWLGIGDSTRDEWPVNCLPPLDADAICRSVGGHLPSEAQWEYAARGRERGWLFPWGDDFPECCSANLARLGPALAEIGCPGYWLAEVGSFSDPDACEGRVDISLDGVVDLGGSLAEATLDAWVPYDDSTCWGEPGIRRDPACRVEDDFVVMRGGDWSGGTSLARSTFRRQALPEVPSITSGFRCVYQDAQ